jgi:hypothetical protein
MTPKSMYIDYTHRNQTMAVCLRVRKCVSSNKSQAPSRVQRTSSNRHQAKKIVCYLLSLKYLFDRHITIARTTISTNFINLAGRRSLFVCGVSQSIALDIYMDSIWEDRNTNFVDNKNRKFGMMAQCDH